jgi:Sulfatase-modifying factor enzyme 1
VPESLRRRLPLLVPLRDFGKDMDCGRGRPWHRGDLEQALAAWVDQLALPGLDGAMTKAHLAAGSAFMLLDGLDEVPVSESRNGATVHPRQLLLSGLKDALPKWEAAGNRTLLSSRPYGLDEAGLAHLRLPRAALEPLPEPLQELFVRRWFHTLKREELGGELLEAMGSRDDLAPLAENPMLLTAMCVLYDKGRRLPQDRYELYKSIVDGVLHSRYPGDAREREPVLRRLEAIAYGMHTGEPDEAPRQTPAAEISWNETERLLADFAERNPSVGQGEVAAAVQRDELLTRSGLLLPRPNERAAFYHLSFQEFLAAQRIARGSEKRVTEAIDARAAVSEWRPTLLCLFAAQLFNKDPEWGLDLLARLLEGQKRAAVKANPAPAVFIAEALELCLAKRYRIPEALAESFRRLSLDAIEDEVEVQARQALGLCLGRLGDPRVLDLRDPRAYVEVPAGTYLYGEKGGTVEIAAPFLLGRYPVTNSQYQAFVDDGGYSKRKWWSEAGWDWLQKEGITEPLCWRDRGLDGPASRWWA